MNYAEKYLQSGKEKIYTQSWTEEKPKAIVGIIHGMGEHSGRYAHMAAFLNLRGYNVYAMDHIGHGKSTGQRGHVDSYDLLLDSLQVFLDEINSNNSSKLPVFLFAHSMGGNVLANFLIRRKPAIQGAVLSAPWFKLGFDPPAFQLWLGKLMYKIYPAFPNGAKIDATILSKDPIEVEKYMKDPMVHGQITPGFFIPMLNNGLWAMTRAAEITIPVLIYHGTADKLISPEGSKEFKAHAGPNVELKLWEGVYHEAHNDYEKIEVMTYMTEWLDKHIS